eukprot:4046601-Ditylum_brightwellii.AAC.1
MVREGKLGEGGDAALKLIMVFAVIVSLSSSSSSSSEVISFCFDAVAAVFVEIRTQTQLTAWMMTVMTKGMQQQLLSTMGYMIARQ